MRKSLLFSILMLTLFAGRCFAASGGKIAYVKDGRVYISDQEGKHSRSITPAKGEYRSPRWSPDGKWIACIKLDEEKAIPMAFSTQSTKSIVMKSLAYRTSVPSWSPDSKSVIFACDENPDYNELNVTGLYTYNVATNSLKKVLTGHPSAAAYISHSEVVYIDNTSCRAFYYSLRGERITDRVKLDEDDFKAPDCLTIEVMPIGKSIVCRNESQAGSFLSCADPGRESWFTRMVKTLTAEMDSKDQGWCDFATADDGGTAYMVFNNSMVLGMDDGGPAKGRNRIYAITRRGARLIFKDESTYTISRFLPLSDGRLLLEIQPINDNHADMTGLRIYDPSAKKWTIPTREGSDSAVWSVQNSTAGRSLQSDPNP